MKQTVQELVDALLALTPDQQDEVTDLLIISEKPWGKWSEGKPQGAIRKRERAKCVAELRARAEMCTESSLLRKYLGIAAKILESNAAKAEGSTE